MPGGTMGAVGAKPMSVAVDPFGITWQSAFWAGDPNWANPGNGNAIDVWRNAGTLRTATTSAARLDASKGLFVPSGSAQLAAKIAHAASMNVTDIDFRCRLELADWTPATNPRGIVEKRYSNNVTDLSWEFALRTDGTLQTILTSNGSDTSIFVSTAAVSATDGQSLWLRTTVDADNGASGMTCRFYQGADGAAEPVSWTQIGTDVVIAGPKVIYNSTHPTSLGTAGVVGDAWGIGGYMKRAVQYTGIGSGTKIYDVDFVRADTGKFVEDGPDALTVEVRSNWDVSQFTTAHQPLYRSSVSALNNKPAVQGDGSNDRLVTPGVLTFTQAQPFSVVIIEAGSAASKSPADVNPSNGWLFYRNSSKYQSRSGVILSEPGSSADSGAHLMRYLANGSSSVMAENEVVLGTGNAGTDPAVHWSICGSNANFNTAATIAFVGLYAGDVTAAPGWAEFKAWAAAEYGLVL